MFPELAAGSTMSLLYASPHLAESGDVLGLASQLVFTGVQKRNSAQWLGV